MNVDDKISFIQSIRCPLCNNYLTREGATNNFACPTKTKRASSSSLFLFHSDKNHTIFSREYDCWTIMSHHTIYIPIAEVYINTTNYIEDYFIQTITIGSCILKIGFILADNISYNDSSVYYSEPIEGGRVLTKGILTPNYYPNLYSITEKDIKRKYDTCMMMR